MNHEQFKEWLHLSMPGELTADESASLKEHLAGCSECRTELEGLQKLQAKLTRSEVPDDLLQEARRELRVALRLEQSRVSLWSQITERIDELLAPGAKLAVGGALTLAVGFLAGALMFRSVPAGNGANSGLIAQKVSDETMVSRGESQLTNVRFIDSDPSDGEVEFTFDAISPVRIKGSVNDPGVQSVLMKALMEGQNPGVRLHAVSAITSQIQIQTKADPQVKQSLIEAMKFDENPGVRQEALQALRKFPFDDDIRDGLLYILTKDKNQGMRVEAINSLMEAKDQIKSSSDDQLLDILRKKMETEDNKYVRRGVRAVLEEVQP